MPAATLVYCHANGRNYVTVETDECCLELTTCASVRAANATIKKSSSISYIGPPLAMFDLELNVKHMLFRREKT